MPGAVDWALAERVAVKVRRPGVSKQFTADLRIIDAMTLLAERLTLARPDFFNWPRAVRRAPSWY